MRQKSKKKLMHLHVLVHEEDIKIIDAITSNYGDRSLIIRGIISNFAANVKKNIKITLVDGEMK